MENVTSFMYFSQLLGFSRLRMCLHGNILTPLILLCYTPRKYSSYIILGMFWMIVISTIL